MFSLFWILSLNVQYFLPSLVREECNAIEATQPVWLEKLNDLQVFPYQGSFTKGPSETDVLP